MFVNSHRPKVIWMQDFEFRPVLYYTPNRSSWDMVTLARIAKLSTCEQHHDLLRSSVLFINKPAATVFMFRKPQPCQH